MSTSSNYNAMRKVKACWIMYQNLHNVRWSQKMSYVRIGFLSQKPNFFLLKISNIYEKKTCRTFYLNSFVKLKWGPPLMGDIKTPLMGDLLFESPFDNPHTSLHYCIKRFKRDPQLSPLIPRDARLSGLPMCDFLVWGIYYLIWWIYFLVFGFFLAGPLWRWCPWGGRGWRAWWAPGPGRLSSLPAVLR